MSGRLDIITLRGLSARGHHGVFAFEREGTQPFSVDLALYVDTRAAAAADDINLTVSYADIAEETVAVLEGPSVYLLETLAQRIAGAALAHPRVEGVEVTIHKPMAPLRQQFSDVTVTIQRGNTEILDEDVSAEDLSVEMIEGEAIGGEKTDADETAAEASPETPIRVDGRVASADVVLALGGNVGDAPTTLTRAVAGLVELDGLDIDEVSPLVRTTPVLAEGQKAQSDYWNAIVLAHTTLTPSELLAATSAIETKLGRVRHEHWGARTIDIDLVQFEGVTSDDPELTLPHPRAHERAFVLVPWGLVDPEAELEGSGRVDVLAAHAPDRGGILDAVSGWLEDPASVIAESDEVLGRHAEQSAASEQDGDPSVSNDSGEGRDGAEFARHSRLDLLPEVSRRDLSPTDTGEDYLWRSLWARWQAPLPEDAAGVWAAGAGAGAGAEDGDSEPGATATEGAGAESGTTSTIETSIITAGTPAVPDSDDAGDTSSELRPEPEPQPRSALGPEARPEPSEGPRSEPASDTASESTPEPSSTHGAGPAHVARQGSGRRGRAPRWLPVHAGTARHEAQVARTPELPTWSFTGPEDVRIVDDPQDLAPVTDRSTDTQSDKPSDTPPDTRSDTPTPASSEGSSADDAHSGASATETGSVRRRSVLDPHLPPNTPTGPIERDETTQTSIIRGITVRPTVTGHRAVTRRGTRGQP